MEHSSVRLTCVGQSAITYLDVTECTAIKEAGILVHVATKRPDSTQNLIVLPDNGGALIPFRL